VERKKRGKDGKKERRKGRRKGEREGGKKEKRFDPLSIREERAKYPQRARRLNINAATPFAVLLIFKRGTTAKRMAQPLIHFNELTPSSPANHIPLPPSLMKRTTKSC